MENNIVPEFAIVGHPKEGKSSVVSTLTVEHISELFYDDSFSQIPESEYIGDYCGPDECTYTPLEGRESD